MSQTELMAGQERITYSPQGISLRKDVIQGRSLQTPEVMQIIRPLTSDQRTPLPQNTQTEPLTPSFSPSVHVLQGEIVTDPALRAKLHRWTRQANREWARQEELLQQKDNNLEPVQPESSPNVLQGEIVTDPVLNAKLHRRFERAAREMVRQERVGVKHPLTLSYVTRNIAEVIKNKNKKPMSSFSSEDTRAHERQHIKNNTQPSSFYPTQSERISSSPSFENMVWLRKRRSISQDVSRFRDGYFPDEEVSPIQAQFLKKRIDEQKMVSQSLRTVREIQGLDLGNESVQNGKGAHNAVYDAVTDQFIVTNHPEEAKGLLCVTFQMTNGSHLQWQKCFAETGIGIPWLIAEVDQTNPDESWQVRVHGMFSLSPQQRKERVARAAFLQARARQHNLNEIRQYWEQGGDLSLLPKISQECMPDLTVFVDSYVA